MQSNRDERVEALHQEAAGHYLQGDFGDALRVWRELLQIDAEDERAQEGVRLCEMLASDGIDPHHAPATDVAAHPDPIPGDGAAASAPFEEIHAELDDLERLLDDQLGGGLRPPATATATATAPAPANGDAAKLAAALDAEETVAASRAAAAELKRRVIELMEEGRGAIAAGDLDAAEGVLRRVLILDDANEEAQSLLDELANAPAPAPESEDLERETISLGTDGPDEDCEDLLAHVDFGLEGATPASARSAGATAAPIGQEGDMPEGVEGFGLAGDPGARTTRGEDARDAVRRDGAAGAAAGASAEPALDSAPHDARIAADPEDPEDPEETEDPAEADAEAERHAALHRAAERLARIHAEEASTVSVRRLGRGLILGGVGVALLLGVGIGLTLMLGAFGEAEEPLLPPAPVAAKPGKAGKGGGGEAGAAGAANGADGAAGAATSAATPVPDAQVAEWMESAAGALRQGEYDAAIPLLHRVLEARPDHAEAQATMRFAAERYQAEQMLARKEKEAYDAFQRGDYRSALRAFYRLPEETGRNYDRQIANGWYNLGVQALRLGDCDGAAEHLVEVRQIVPDHPGLHAAGTLARACPKSAGTEPYLRGTAQLQIRRADQ